MRALFIAILCMVVSQGHCCFQVEASSTGGIRWVLFPGLKTSIISRIENHDAVVPKGTPCLEGYHFGTDKNRLWIDKNCAGKFDICNRPGDDMSCTERRLSSGVNKRYYRIDLNDNVYTMHVVRKLRKKCIKGQTYGIQGKRVWVSDRCRAIFYMCVENS